ncbi:hypothetical protein BT96DRAFT_597613 [Gymnopus androsaceus JB14]|uniref:Uncharacterized protein n=1 Tax=Gymnopus androsaceus JB14 TaxID=1447944 RepID=A0A6A4HR42_9AGAR|nr:hypothetical protein BT96DRAFT_597613 [Gymnopus androsaceus JB14]
MAALTASPYFSHPWFDKPTMKRRRSSSSEDDAPLSPASSKRRRVKALERGFSNLTLQHLQPTSSLAVASPVSVSSPPSAFPSSPPNDFDITAMEVDYDSSSMLPFIQPDSVEEPHSSTPPEQVPEIRMKGSSWYEPEPDRESSLVSSQPSHQDSKKSRFTGIVVTDLDSSEDEEESEPLHPVISPALLERIRRRELSVPVPELSLQNQQALVLYRPLNRPSTTAEEEEKEPKLDVAVLNSAEVEMMDIEQ